MERLVALTAALDAKKLPSTQQINAFVAWLEQTSDSEAKLSVQGRVLAGDLTNVLESYRQLNSNKNDDNLLQEAVWHLTEGDINTAVGSSNLDKQEISSDLNAVRTSLRTILSLVWQGLISEGNPLVSELASFARLGLADAAEVVQDTAGRAKDTLRNVEQEVEDGQRDSLGRDRARMEAEQGDKRATFENRMDTLKGTGSQAIGVTQSTREKAQELSGQTSERLGTMPYDAYYNACKIAQQDPEYRSALSTLLSTAQKWVIRALDSAPNEPWTLDSFTTTPDDAEGHIPAALTALRTLLNRVAEPQSSVEHVEEAADHFLRAMQQNREPAKAWVIDSFAHAQRMLDDPNYAQTDEARRTSEDLADRGQALVDPEMESGRAWATLKQSGADFSRALAADADVARVRAAHERLGRVAADTGGLLASLDTKQALEPWFYRDLVAVHAQRALTLLRRAAIPRAEYTDGEVELVLEDLDVSSVHINPAHVSVESTARVDVRTGGPGAEAGVEADMGGMTTHVRVRAVQLALRDVSFYFRDLKSHTPAFTGLLTLTLPPQGVTAEWTMRVLQDHEERKRRGALHSIDGLRVELADEVEVGVRDSNHAITLMLVKPLFRRGVRRALTKVLAAQLQAAVEGADAIAYEVVRRTEVFRDTGMGKGAAIAAAVWSEARRLLQERKFGAWATETGVVVVQGEHEEGEKRLAMGAEPQVLDGEKQGPAGSGARSSDQSLPPRAPRGAAVGIVGEAGGQVRSFKHSVDERAQAEKRTLGWRSDAFDV